MQNQTREILRRLNAGKKATHIATELGVPPYVVYNTKTRYRRELKSRKVAVTSDGTKPLSQRVFEFIQANPDLRACEYGEAFAAVGERSTRWQGLSRTSLTRDSWSATPEPKRSKQ